MNKIFLLIIFLGFNFFIMADEGIKKVSRYERLELFSRVMHIVESQYYRKVNINKLIDGALKGMLNTLDPHTSFLSENIFSKIQEDTSGEYKGLGIEVTKQNNSIIIVTPIEGSPAFKAGIKARDRIIEINHESTVGITLEESIEKMKGKTGEHINLGILRKGSKKIKYFDIARKIVKIKSVKSYIANNYILIKLRQFQKNSTEYISRAIKKHRKELKKNLKGIILDLRSNPGGLLEEAVDVASLFLKEGIVVSTEGRNPKNKEIRYVKKTGYKELEVKMGVLINESSASASEIVAGALQDYKRALIFGIRSFGKGSVQSVIQISKNQGVKLTMAQYMTPKGRKIQAIGIKPDIKIVELEGKYLKNNFSKNDYFREEDLRNHLTSTLETSEEKQQRIQKKKDNRRKKILASKKISQEKQKDIFSKYNPMEDYQVQEVIRFLDAFSLVSKKNEEV